MKNKFKQLWAWFKKVWKKIKGLASKTKADDILLAELLDLGIDYFMRHVNGKLKKKLSARELLDKFENSIRAKVKATDNKFDDFFLPFLTDAIQKLDLTSIERLLNHYDMQLILRKVKATILEKWDIAQKKAAK